jgi:hypothetical protein
VRELLLLEKYNLAAAKFDFEALKQEHAARGTVEETRGV